MDQTKSIFFMLIALIALAIAVMALYSARTAQQLALSDVTLEERSPLLTPVFNEGTNSWSYLAIYDVNITNVSGPEVKLTSIGKVNSGTGFLVPLQGEDVMDTQLLYKAFLVEPTLSQIMADPKLLKTIVEKDMGQSVSLNIDLPPGASKSLRFGVSIEAYDSANQPLAQVILLSYRLQFDNGKSLLFRRGFPIQALGKQG